MLDINGDILQVGNFVIVKRRKQVSIGSVSYVDDNFIQVTKPSGGNFTVKNTQSDVSIVDEQAINELCEQYDQPRRN